ncbi:hypothetical protein B0H15DRAFT_1022084 [Mycena belliarum]|uniref:Uncharacterized protein n=1 Tax=Mycena belliarum TaxID=1033014 RepID=A0AAD6U9Q1_9AGAR|nr:hypothetical protein B0H15DRAFT_1022084 [Mycena belliae]
MVSIVLTCFHNVLDTFLPASDGPGLRLSGAELVSSNAHQSGSSVRRAYTPALIAVRRGLGIRSRPRLSMVSIVLTCFRDVLDSFLPSK